MQPVLFIIDRLGAGQLSTMARPRGGDWLTGEMRDLASAGVTMLVSLLTDAEAAELELDDEANAASLAGLDFRRLPTPDRHVPDRAAALAVAEVLRHRLAAARGCPVPDTATQRAFPATLRPAN